MQWRFLLDFFTIFPAKNLHFQKNHINFAIADRLAEAPV